MKKQEELTGLCKQIQDAVDRGDKCELGELNWDRIKRKESYRI